MKAPEETTLNQKILLECREEVATEMQYQDWETCLNDQPNFMVEKVCEKVALLAMEKQAWFHWWANKNYVPQENKTWLAYDEQGNLDTRKTYTELELYEIFQERN